MADNESIVKIKTEGDDSGAKAVEKAVEKTGDAAERANARAAKAMDGSRRASKQFADETKRAGETVAQSFGRITKAAGLFRNVLTGFGVVGIFNTLANGVGTLINSFKQAEKDAAALDKAAQMEEAQKAVQALADHYRDLAKAMADADAEMARMNELQEKSVQNARSLQDAQLAAAEAREIAAVDPNDPTAAEQMSVIRAKYASQRSGTSVERKKEDILREEERLRGTAGKKEKDAAAIEGTLPELDRQIAAAEGRARNARKRSNSLNDEDYGHGVSQFGANIKRIVTFDWGSVGNEESKEGDAIRAEARQEAKAAEEDVKRLKEERAKRVESAKGLRSEAAHLTSSADAVHESLESIKYEREAATVTSKTASDAADRAKAKAEEREKKRRSEQIAADLQHNADKNLIASAPTEGARMQAEADAAQARLNEADAARSARLVDVQHRRMMGRVSDGAASREVTAAESEFMQVEAEVGAILTRLREEMKSFQAELRKAESREQSYKEGA